MTRTTLGWCVAVLALAAPAAAQERPGYVPERSVTTSGMATVKMAPDRAWVTVGIEARAPKSQDAQKKAAVVMQAIQAQLKALGIPDNAIRTISFNLNADWDYTNNKRVLRGYVVSNMVEVKVDDITKVGDVLDRSISAGGNAIHGVRWDLQNRERVDRDALRQAVEDAKQRAEVSVAAAGARLGPVMRINEQRSDYSPRMDMMMMQRGAVAAAPAPPPETMISPGEIELRAMVTVTFSIL